MVDVFPVVPQSRWAIIEIDGQRISLKLPVNARVSVSTRERELTGNGTTGPFVLSRWLHILKEARMRIPALAILMMATVLTAAPARAQTYDPAYPVCLQIYQGWNDYYFECAYTSLPQCNASVSVRRVLESYE